MKKSTLILLAFLWIINLNAQVFKPANRDFEVSASLYPWDVHDEGIELMLDNLISTPDVMCRPQKHGCAGCRASVFEIVPKRVRLKKRNAAGRLCKRPTMITVKCASRSESA